MKSFIGAIILTLGSCCSFFAQCPSSIEIIRSVENPVCKNSPVTFSVLPKAGAITDYIWVVNGDTISNAATLTTSINFAHVEVYAVSDTCNLDTLFSDSFILNTEFTVDYTVIVEECNQPVADVQINNISGGLAPYTYSLFVEDVDNGQADLYPDLSVSSYPLVVQDANNCIDTFWINIEVTNCPLPDPKEVFTPNEDGFNDGWIISYIHLYPDNEVFIYDRWGQRVYHKKGYENNDPWKAQYVGANMPVSTYYYILKVNFEKQDQIVYNGAISIFR